MALASDIATLGHVTTEVAPASSRQPSSDHWPGRPWPASDRSATRRLEALLFRRYQRDGDLNARRQLIERYLPLARSLAPPPASPEPRAPLRAARRVARRSPTGGEPRASQGDRPLRTRARTQLLKLR